LFVATFNVAWSVRNFLLVSHCEMGDCPVKKVGIYAVMFFSFVMLVMALLPKVELKE
jgi:hypothetical protein